jgi:uncharacterized membrane protein
MDQAAAGLVIDWTQMPTYNTIMSVAAGAGLLSLVWFVRIVVRGEEANYEAWALSFGVPGGVLLATGLHMTLTWPFAKYFPFDNIIFGETSLGFGSLLVGAAFYLWRRSTTLQSVAAPGAFLADAAMPMSFWIVGLGLSLIAIAAAGVVFQLFAAPKEEPITGLAADYPWIEATAMSGLFGLVGIGAVLSPLALRSISRGEPNNLLRRFVGFAWALTGAAFLLFGALNFFTHIGLIVHTMA